MDFPPYEYRPYPKYVNGVIVQDEIEHQALLKTQKAPAPKAEEATEQEETDAVDLNVLRGKAAELGIVIDGRWGVERLKQAIADKAA